MPMSAPALASYADLALADAAALSAAQQLLEASAGEDQGEVYARGFLMAEGQRIARSLLAAVQLDEPAIYSDYVNWLLSALGYGHLGRTQRQALITAVTTALVHHSAPALRPRIERTVAAYQGVSGDPAPTYMAHLPPPRTEVEAMVTALLQGDHAGAWGLYQQVRGSGVSSVESHVRLLQPAMYRIGQLWQENQITVTDEHLASAICHDVITRAYTESEPAPPQGRRAVVACVEDNLHALGARMVADALDQQGWEVKFLGADTPHSDLLQTVTHQQPELLALSISMTMQLPATQWLISRLQHQQPNLKVRIGGLAINTLPPAVSAADPLVGGHHALEALERLAP